MSLAVTLLRASGWPGGRNHSYRGRYQPSYAQNQPTLGRNRSSCGRNQPTFAINQPNAVPAPFSGMGLLKKVACSYSFEGERNVWGTESLTLEELSTKLSAESTNFEKKSLILRKKSTNFFNKSTKHRPAPFSGIGVVKSVAWSYSF
ncbi:hypothetical protein [Bacillus massilinigeriensis]|uniref:hypothetical protein n=1 Tax=Bacillus mediterraneensis TaxID=1805474 RepID=UPI0008F8E0B8|nr:hypothetical protein [Bacillus mediterraneensis]